MSRLLLGLVLVTLGAFPAGGHDRPYVNTLGDLVLECRPSEPLDLGGACFEPGHIGTDTDGTTTVAFVFPCLDCPGHQSGLYCQAATLPASGQAVCDPGGVSFCDAIVLEPGDTWDPTDWVFVFADGVIFGSPLVSVCGAASWSFVSAVGHVF